MRTVGVVVLNVDPQHLLEMAAPKNQQPVQALGPHRDKEVARHDPGRLLAQERPPGRGRPPWRWIQSMTARSPPSAGRPPPSVLAGSITTTDTRRGPVHLDYEVYSNTYRAFALLLPQRRVTLGKPVRALWRA